MVKSFSRPESEKPDPRGAEPVFGGSQPMKGQPSIRAGGRSSNGQFCGWFFPTMARTSQAKWPIARPPDLPGGYLKVVIGDDLPHLSVNKRLRKGL